MADFRFHVPAECYIGTDSIFKIPLLLEPGLDRALVVADPELREGGAAERLVAVLEGRGIKTILFDDFGDAPTAASVEAAVGLARGSRSPLVIGLGGIHVVHAAKAVAALAPDERRVETWIDGEAPQRQPLPLVLVPTTCRDPFILSGGLILGDARNRQAAFLQARRGIESAVILDPNVMSAMSAKTAAATILDGIMGAVEGYASSKENFLSDMALREAVSLYVRALDVMMARPDDPQAKADAFRAFFMAGLGLASSSPGLGTAVSFAINARWGVPKANLAAVILPYLMESLSRSKLEKIASLAPLFGDVDENEGAAAMAAKAVEAIRTRLGVLKIPSRLKDFDLALERLVEGAETVRRLDFMNFLPRAMTVDDVFDFIKTVY
ncbi:MAG TPA: iron-containing alcohol dehydrogenase [Spirochaetales bacterium]|nr:iron-containing alcohol dehydrogenase [Spirochaetales bacterium]